MKSIKILLTLIALSFLANFAQASHELTHTDGDFIVFFEDEMKTGSKSAIVLVWPSLAAYQDPTAAPYSASHPAKPKQFRVPLPALDMDGLSDATKSDRENRDNAFFLALHQVPPSPGIPGFTATEGWTLTQ